jgi:hypothetical protein
MGLELAITEFIPAAYQLAAATGVMLGVIGTLLLQKGARMWLDEHRAEQHRERLARLEARWREAAM